MDTEESPIANNDLSSELIGLNKNNKWFLDKRFIIAIIAAVSIIVLVIIIISLALNSKKR